jgi:antitoxin component YwqK of YwqJK toxin-antitoxin module
MLRVVLLFLLCLGTAGAQIPTSPNRTNASGEREGKWTLYFDKDMQPVQDADSAVFYSVMTFRGGQVVDTARTYYRGGALMSSTPYRAGRIEGTVTGWYENGVKEFETKSEIHFSKGVVHGNATRWFENGAKHTEIPHVNGRVHGTRRDWFESGARRAEFRYEQGQRHGLSMEWNEDGSVRSRTMYDKGKVVEGK